MKYKVLGAEQDSGGVVDVPDDVTIIGAFYHPSSGILNVVCVQEYEKWKAEQERSGAGKDGAEEKKTEKPLITPAPAGPALSLENPDESLKREVPGG